MDDPGMDKFNFIVPDFSGVQFTSAPHQEGKKTKQKQKQKTGAQNQSVHPIEKQLETLLYVFYYFSI